MKNVVVIAPSFPPSLDAVGSFAKVTSESLQKDFSITYLDREFKNSKAKTQLWESSIVVLHYVGYGFEQRGCPFWLLNTIREWKKSHKGTLITYFHELYAEGGLLSSAFFLAPFQKKLVLELLKISDFPVFTSEYFSKLGAYLYPWSIQSSTILPIPSIIGEPASAPSCESKASAVIFGTPGRRIAVYKTEKASEVLRKMGVSEVLDIGPPIDPPINNWFGININSLGALASDQISNILVDARIGVIDYPQNVLSKSSIFAAYASHGVCPLVTRESAKSFDSLKEGYHYLSLDSYSKDTKVIGEKAFSWYQDHSVEIHRKTIQNLVEKKPGEKKKRVIFLFSQHTQNEAPLRYLALSTKIQVLSVFLSEKNVGLLQGQEYINKEVTHPLAKSAYPSITIKNISPAPSLSSRFGLINPYILQLTKNCDAIVVFGHYFITFWLAILSAVIFQVPIYFTNDAIRGGLKRKLILKYLYRFIGKGVFVPSSSSKTFLTSIGISEEQIYITPYAVDEEQFLDSLNKHTKGSVRKRLRIPESSKIILFCGKLIKRKRAIDILRSFAKISSKYDSHLVIIGDGPLKSMLEAEADSLGISKRTHFVGLLSYHELPGFYKDSDVYVHPADDEPWGLTINEAILSKLPVVASDEVGAAKDLIRDKESGRIFRCKDIEHLTECIEDTLVNSSRYAENSFIQNQSWSSKKVSEVFEGALS